MTSWIDLDVPDVEAAKEFYGALPGWTISDADAAAARVESAGGSVVAPPADGVPPGFGDAIGWMAEAAPGEKPHWHVTFTVADRDASVALVERLGGAVVEQDDTEWTRHGVVRDPAGALFTVSQYTGG